MANTKKSEQKRQVVADIVIQIPLLAETVDELAQMSFSGKDVFNVLKSLADEGYSVNIIKDSKKENYSMRLAGITEGMVNERKLLYGNGDTVELAFLSMYGKHFLQSGGGEWIPTVTSGRSMS